jgi:hypothetical protein
LWRPYIGSFQAFLQRLKNHYLVDSTIWPLYNRPLAFTMSPLFVSSKTHCMKNDDPVNLPLRLLFLSELLQKIWEHFDSQNFLTKQRSNNVTLITLFVYEYSTFKKLKCTHHAILYNRLYWCNWSTVCISFEIFFHRMFF